ncbi:MAG TPA: DUF6596 domain-containing protein, partial [Opitutus sp.]|nr:DUF6596 domain-containing protein [Opitutus sp.]
MNEPAAHATIEEVVRHSYGRLVAYLAARTGDVAGAEDALSDALMRALARWSVDGMPDKPEAWLLRAARNRQIDAFRRQAVRQDAAAFLQQVAAEAETMAERSDEFPDERLKLLFVCAHPGIDPAARTPLMLQTVLGIESARIASAFLVSPSAMEQRLVRAKQKIRSAAVPFRVPEPAEWDERVSFVLDAIYSAYTAGWESVSDESSAPRALARDAVALGRTLVQLRPQEPEALGLLALMLHCEAREAARFADDGRFVPLDEQDTARWSQPLIREAEDLLRRAAAERKPGRFQLEAAIQSIHAHRAISGTIDWAEIALLYEGLMRLAPGIGSQIGRAVALAEIGRADEALPALEGISAERVAAHQPYWAARAHVLRRLKR